MCLLVAENSEKTQGFSGPGPAGYSPDSFRRSNNGFSPRATIGNAKRRPIFSNIRIPGVGSYDTHRALDKIKLSPVKMPIGKACLGAKTKHFFTTTPSPVTYKPSVPYLQQEQRHQGVTIAHAGRLTTAIDFTPGPHEFSHKGSMLTTSGASYFNRTTTYRAHNLLDPIY